MSIPLRFVQAGIQALQGTLLTGKRESIVEAEDMHPAFERAVSELLPVGYRLLHEERYRLPGIERREADYIVVDPDGGRIFMELVFSDQEPKSSFLSNVRKAKGAKDIAVLTHPSMRRFPRYWLFAIRWDISRRLGTPERRTAYRKSCLESCATDDKLNRTRLATLSRESYLERGFFFGDDFCFDFSLNYAERLVRDTQGYQAVRPAGP